MSSENKFGLLRRVLRAIGLSQQSTDDVVDNIVDLLAGEPKNVKAPASVEFPYKLRDAFLSPAELNFYRVLTSVVQDRAVISIKVGLRDLFYVKNNNASQFRIYTNKIDRKHVDFVLCDPTTLQPIVAIELDDSSHQRKDRQERDQFVDQVFAAAGLSVIHVPVKRAYQTAEIVTVLARYLSGNQAPPPVTTNAIPAPLSAPTPLIPLPPMTMPISAQTAAPLCPKCGQPMVHRVTKKGANAGNQFWGCSDYPACRAMVPF